MRRRADEILAGNAKPEVRYFDVRFFRIGSISCSVSPERITEPIVIKLGGDVYCYETKSWWNFTRKRSAASTPFWRWIFPVGFISCSVGPKRLTESIVINLVGTFVAMKQRADEILTGYTSLEVRHFDVPFFWYRSYLVFGFLKFELSRRLFRRFFDE